MKLIRSFATVGGLTLVSRVFGFLRDIMIARLLGSGPIADAFVVAFRFPNLFRRLFGEGAFNSAFVPLFAKKLEGEGDEAARRFAEEAMAGLTFVLVLLSALCMIAMPWLMYLLAPGFAEDPAKFDLTVVMSRIAFPYLLCMSLVALLSGVLNSLRRFAESASVSIVLNVTLIVAILVAMALGFQNDANAGLTMAWGVFVAGILQLLVLIWGVRRSRMMLRLRRPRYTEDMKKLVQLGVPGVIAGGITQINIVIGGMVASLQSGAVAYLYYADRLYELPLAIIGIAIGIVLLPEVSRNLRAGEFDAAHDSQNRALEFALLLTVPAAVALAVVPEPIVRVLFERQAFSMGDTENVSSALTWFAFGLPAFVMIKVFSPGFFAREDTKTPMRYAAISLIVNTVGSVALFFVFQAAGLKPFVGIAIATSIGGWLNAGLLYRGLAREEHFIADRRLKRSVYIVLFASAVMGVGLWFGADVLYPWFDRSHPTYVRFAALAALTVPAMLLYFSIAGLFGVLRLKRLLGRPVKGGNAA